MSLLSTIEVWVGDAGNEKAEPLDNPAFLFLHSIPTLKSTTPIHDLESPWNRFPVPELSKLTNNIKKDKPEGDIWSRLNVAYRQGLTRRRKKGSATQMANPLKFWSEQENSNHDIQLPNPSDPNIGCNFSLRTPTGFHR